LVCPSRNLQTGREIVCVSAASSYMIRCLLLSPAIRSETGVAKHTEGRRLALGAGLSPSLAVWLVNFYRFKRSPKGHFYCDHGVFTKNTGVAVALVQQYKQIQVWQLHWSSSTNKYRCGSCIGPAVQTNTGVAVALVQQYKHSALTCN